MNGASCRRNGRRLRRGTIYLAVLGVAMLVTLIGLSGVLATRVRQRTAGMASAAASDTMPRTPVKASTNGHCHGGAGSLRAIAGTSRRGR